MHPLIGRLQQSVVTLLAALTIGFVLINQLPRGPFQILTNMYTERELQSMSAEEIQQAMEQVVGYDATGPLYMQYIDYLNSIVHLDFGTSILYQEPVYQVLAPAIPWTVLLSTLAMVINTSVAFSLGVYMAYREGSRFDVGSTFISLIVSAIPYYVVAILTLVFLGFQTPFFPTGGRFASELTPGFNVDFILSILWHASLPVISLSVTSFAALGLRAHSIRVLGADYIRVARLRGLRERRIVFQYVLRNSILPFYTGLVMGVVGILGGSVITEFVFQYPGMGWYMFKAAAGSDIPLVLATFTFFTVGSVVMLFVVDLTYSWVDPRAEGVGSDEAF